MAFDNVLTKTRQTEMAEEAAKLIRKGWTKNLLATTKRGNVIDVLSEKAVNFCALGALSHSVKTDEDDFVVNDIIRKFGDIVGMSITFFNDNCAKSAEDVAEVFDQIAKDNN